MDELLGNLVLLSIIVIMIITHIFAFIIADFVASSVEALLSNHRGFRDGFIHTTCNKLREWLWKIYYSAGVYSPVLYLLVVPIINIPVFIFVCYLFYKIKVSN